MNERLIGTIVAISLAASATLVNAAGHSEGGPKGPHGGMPKFEEMDANNDGQLSKDEMDAFAKAHFAKMDANNDGLLSAEEMAQDGANKMMRRQERMISRMDQNDDGLLSFDEINAKMAQRGEKMFERLDADGDGLLSKDEMAKMMRGKGGHDGERGGKGGHKGKHDDAEHHGKKGDGEGCDHT
jgi:Ca2+-binding EF-hand superfamily protein